MRTCSHKLITNFTDGNNKLSAANWGKLVSGKYVLDIITNGLKLGFKEIPKNRQYWFKKLKDDELSIVKLQLQKPLKKSFKCFYYKQKGRRKTYYSKFKTIQCRNT